MRTFTVPVTTYVTRELTDAEFALFVSMFQADRQLVEQSQHTQIVWKVRCIKYIRQRDNIGLKEAKDFIDYLWLEFHKGHII